MTSLMLFPLPYKSIYFGDTTLAEIVKAFGNGTITRNGNSGSAIYEWFLKYRWKNQIVTFSSNNDMGGPSHDLEEVDIDPARNVPEEQKLPVIEGVFSFPFGEPGMSFAALQQKLGKAQLENNHAEYEYPGHVMGKDYNGKTLELAVSGWLRVEIANDNIGRIQVSRITSS